MLATTVIIAPHLLGGVFAWGTVVIAALAWLSLPVLELETRSDDTAAMGTEPLLWVFGVILFASLAQVLPLPPWLAGMLAADAVANEHATAVGLGRDPPAWVAFSLDPGRTYERVVFSLAVLSAFTAARALRKLVSSTQLLVIVAVSITLLALSQLGHQLVGSTRVYGLYASYLPGSHGPIINPNNRAGFMALGFPLCLGLALHARGVMRAAWFLVASVVGATGWLAGSRGGVAVLVGGALLFTALHTLRNLFDGRRAGRTSKEGPTLRRWRAGVGSVAWGGAMLAAGYGLAELANDDFLETNYGDLSKLELFGAELRMLRDCDIWRLLLGVGRGAFAASFTTAYGGEGRALYAESLPLQLAIELGVPLAVLLTFACIARISHRFLRSGTSAQLGALVGVIAIGLQNLVDFSLELSGIAVPTVVALAAALPSVRLSSTRIAAWCRVSMASRAAAVGGVAVLAICGPLAYRADILSAERALRGDLQEGRMEALWERLTPALRMHPAEASLASLAAAAAVQEHARNAPFWLNRAMALAPGWEGPHLYAARWFWSIGRRDQAVGELRLAAEAALHEAPIVLCQFLEQQPTADVALASAPDQQTARRVMLNAAAECLAAHPAQAARVDDAVLADDAEFAPALQRHARRSLYEHDWVEAARRAQRLRTLHPSSTQPYVIESEALRSQGDPAGAVRLLLSAPENVDDRRAILQALAFAQAETKDEKGMRTTVQRLRAEAAGDTRQLTNAMVLLGQCEASLGNKARAMRAVREAHQLGGGETNLAQAAHLATQLGQLDLALSAWTQLCNSGAAESYYCAQRDGLLKRVQAP